METIKITLNEETKEFEKGTNFYQITKEFNQKDIIAVLMENEVTSLDTKAIKDGDIKCIRITDLAGYKIYQAALKFMFLVAVKELYPKSEVNFLHSVPKGILSEIDTEENLTSEDISRIKGYMARMVEEKLRFVKYNLEVKDAYHYLKEKGLEEKASNIQSLPNEIVTMYRLKNELNYFYNIMPYDTSVLSRFELVFLGRNRVVLVCPNVVSGTSIPEYVHYENIVSNFMSTKLWLKRLGVTYLSQMNELVSVGKIKEFIESNEIYFQSDIRDACDKVISMRDVRIVLIAGPSSSGKTTTTKRLGSYLRSRGFDPVCLSTDDFFVDREDTPKNEMGEYDYECLQAIDLDLFNKTLQKLLKGKKVEIPEYDFVSGKKKYNGNLWVI